MEGGEETEKRRTICITHATAGSLPAYRCAPPRVASSLARAAEALDAQAPGPFRRNVRHNPALAGWEADAVRRDNTPSTENSCSKVGANLVE